MPIRQDRIIETQSQSGEMMIKNTQDKKENAKNESMLSEQYVHKKSIIQTQSQSGRSMVEMLGVLAIIGVLSIGGIAGYKYAMNYYQANQIAHEINLMRTDAQVKIAQGAEELVLGNPYDDGNINFNNYETDFDCIYMENEEAKPDLAFCNAANAYYIEMQNIPEGVCRPLANLIDKMDNEIAFYINGKSVDAVAEGEKGACNEEPNTLRVIFGADSDSESIKCDDDTNCPPELPVCFNHMCVECTQEKGCEGKSQYCKDNTCKTCESGVWNGEECVACTDNDDCENPTPYCNPTNNQCEPCQDDSHCDITQNEHCKTSKGECVVCEDGSEWDKKTEACMSCSNRECADNDDCCKDYFCEKGFSGDHSTSHSNPTGTCEPLGEVKSISLNGKPLYGSDKFLVWWDGCRWCEALHGQSGSQCDENTYESNYMVGIEEIDWQCAGFDDVTSSQRVIYCCYVDGVTNIRGTQVSPSYHNEVVCDASKEKSSTIKELRKLYNNDDVYIWFKNSSRAEAWYILFANLYQGYISNLGVRYDDKTSDRARTICK